MLLPAAPHLLRLAQWLLNAPTRRRRSAVLGGKSGLAGCGNDHLRQPEDRGEECEPLAEAPKRGEEKWRTSSESLCVRPSPCHCDMEIVHVLLSASCSGGTCSVRPE